MTAPDARLERLIQVAALKRDAEMRRLRRAADACAETRARLLELDVPGATELDPVQFHARQMHRRWAQEQKERLNQTLALQRAEWLQRRNEAATAFGRALAIARLGPSAQRSRR